ncbi:hypothetical protein HJFPF1_11667 [Paramyrothecium foliicola]|nr:hypothetical protein HJFPF1_11667 [Paramyrothecium foliicola]
MSSGFRLKHLPALYFGAANFVSAIIGPFVGAGTVMGHFGLPPRIAGAPEAWPAWHAGQGRTALLGLLMFYFYWRRRYDVCDVFLAGTVYLGVNDFIVLYSYDQSWAWFRLVASAVFALPGFLGWTAAR